MHNEDAIIKKLEKINLDSYDYNWININGDFTPDDLKMVLKLYNSSRIFNEKDQRIFYILSYYIIKNGDKSFKDINDFFKACKYCLEVAIKYNDPYNANNILQIYNQIIKDNNLTKGLWYYRLSIQLYSTRFPNYYLEKPYKLYDKIKGYEVETIRLENYNITGESKELFDEVINNLIKKFIYKCYYELNDQNKEVYKDFVNYFKGQEKDLTEDFNLGVKIIENILNNEGLFKENITDLDEVMDIRRVYEDCGLAELVVIEGDVANIETYKSFVSKPICIIGDSKINRDDIRRKFKENNFNPFNIEFISYEESTNVDIKQKYGNNKYTAIIIAATPHSTKGKGNSSSVVSYFRKEKKRMAQENKTHLDNGFCKVFIAQTESGTLKLTGKNLDNILNDLVNIRTKLKDELYK